MRSLVLPCLFLIACSSESARTPATVRDSAGVAIVDLGRLDYATLPTWVLEGEPGVRIGVVAGDPVRQWSRLDGAGRLSDGTLLGLDKTSRQVRAFSAEGTHLWTAGGDGEGPGEFRFPWALTVLPGDSILVSDPGTGRITVFGPGGAFVRTSSLLALDGQLLTWGLLGPTEVLYEVRSFRRTEADPRIVEDFSRLGGVDLDGTRTQEFGTFLLEIEYPEGNDADAANSPAIFDDVAHFAPWDGAVWFTANEAYQIERYGAGQVLERIVRWSGPDRTVRPEDVQSVSDVYLEGASDERTRQYVQDYLRYHPVAPAFAPFSRMRVDPGGRIWLQDYLRDDLPDADAAWLILGPDGAEVVGRVRHPRRFTPLALGPDWVLGVTRDELDVEYLDLYALPVR
ncbi:MAG: hypothetical protein R3E98_20890 [Gemmatimonadota bacterium]